MDKITKEMWKDAEKKLFIVRKGWDKQYRFVRDRALKARYDKGERTEELYNAIMELK